MESFLLFGLKAALAPAMSPGAAGMVYCWCCDCGADDYCRPAMPPPSTGSTTPVMKLAVLNTGVSITLGAIAFTRIL
jgi:hypothetical protein